MSQVIVFTAPGEMVACKRTHNSDRRLSPLRQATAGNTSAFAS